MQTGNRRFYKLGVMSELGDRLRKARAAAKLTQLEVAQKVGVTGVTQPTIADLENGESQGSKWIVEIALACGVSPIWLAMGRGPMKLSTIEALIYGVPAHAEKQIVAVLEALKNVESG